MRKSSMQIALWVAALALVADTAFASGPPINLPDGGSSALLIAISGFGLAVVRKFLRK